MPTMFDESWATCTIFIINQKITFTAYTFTAFICPMILDIAYLALFWWGTLVASPNAWTAEVIRLEEVPRLAFWTFFTQIVTIFTRKITFKALMWCWIIEMLQICAYFEYRNGIRWLSPNCHHIFPISYQSWVIHIVAISSNIFPVFQVKNFLKFLSHQGKIVTSNADCFISHGANFINPCYFFCNKVVVIHSH